VWFLENAWLIPLLPAVSFALILLFGKRLPRRGSELGVAAVGASFVLACGAVYQWIDRVRDADAAEGGEHALGVLGSIGRSLGIVRPLAEEGGEHKVAAAVEPVTRSITWLQNGGIKLTAGIQIDGLAVMMLFVVTIISLLVHVYSLEYMRGDSRFTHYYAALSLFTASMLTLVVADNTLQLLVGWELVGLCSFILIGHWWEDKPNSDAAVKAFLTTRTGDVGLMIGIIILFVETGGTFDIIDTNTQALAGQISHGMLLAASCTLLLGIIGKSGQFPLHTWLPDAMAGPTPVSALIHAATMVVAGIYLGARLYGVFWEGFSIADGGVNLMAIIGAITVIIGALLAFVQDDIKKVLAYSTISQLGYMVMGLGVGAWVAAVFHLFTHAFFKALLFLGAGSVSHSGAHHSFDMKKDMGGLRKYMPQTYATFVIGTLALAGIPPLAGFWSKDEILATAGQGGFAFFYWVGLAGAFLTAAYMTRCIWYTFHGEYRGGAAAHADPTHAAGDDLVEHHLAEVQEPEHGGVAVATHADAHHGEPHESPPLLTVPLWILAAFSAGAGFLNAVAFEWDWFTRWFEPRIAFPVDAIFHPEFETGEAILAIAVAVAGIGAAYLYYWRGIGLVGLAERSALARAGKRFLERKYYLDVLYTDVVVGSVKGPVARAAYWVNQQVIDNVLNYAGRGSAAAAAATYRYVDQAIIDGGYDGLAAGTGEVGALTRRFQTGRLQWYALMLVIGVAILTLAIVIAN
jgi:NADH-quinone oxidoreductase subunit L